MYVGHEIGARFACPECGLELSVCDHSGERMLFGKDQMGKPFREAEVFAAGCQSDGSVERSKWWLFGWKHGSGKHHPVCLPLQRDKTKVCIERGGLLIFGINDDSGDGQNRAGLRNLLTGIGN